MKNKIIILLIGFIGFFLNQNKAQEVKCFTLNCHFKGLPDGTKVYLITKEKDTIAKAISKGEYFVFNGHLPLDGRFHFIKMDTLISNIYSKAIFLMNMPMSLYGTVGKREFLLEGSPGHLEYEDMLNSILEIKKRELEHTRVSALLVNSLFKDSISKDEYETRREELASHGNLLQKEHIQIGKAWIANHPASLYSPYVIGNYWRAYGIEGVEKAYDKLTSEAKMSYYGTELKKSIESEKLASLIKIGQILPDFKVSSLDQKSFSVLDCVKKGKITLIDFWASWCSPCRAEIPNMKRVYDAFHNKGFNIIGVSSDAKEVDWKKALSEDNTPWYHGRDDIEKAMKAIFGIKAIPAFALVDGEGKLIAFECGMSNIQSFGPPIRGEELYKTIEDLLNKDGRKGEK